MRKWEVTAGIAVMIITVVVGVVLIFTILLPFTIWFVVEYYFFRERYNRIMSELPLI